MSRENKTGKMGKKGIAFVAVILIMTFFALLFALIVLTIKYDVMDVKGITRMIGDKQSTVFQAYQTGEDSLFYAEQSANLASLNSLESLAEAKSGCGTYLGYSVWSGKGMNCTPTPAEAEKDFTQIFDSEMSKFLSAYSYALLPSANYDYSLSVPDQGKIMLKGNAKSPVYIFLGGTSTYTAAQIDSYFKSQNSPLEGLGQCFVDAESKTKIPSSVMMAITAHESNYGKSSLAGDKCLNDNLPSNNLFSIKSSASKQGTAGQCKWATYECLTPTQASGISIISQGSGPFTCGAGTSIFQIYDYFRAYTTKCDSVNDFIALMQSPRYWDGNGKSDNPLCSPIKNYLDQPQNFVRNILYCGYSTDPKWADGVISIMSDISSQLGAGLASTGTGVYSIMPDFKTEFSYDFNEYSGLNKSLAAIADTIERTCYKPGTDETSCIKNVLSQDKSFEWSLNCGSDEENAALNLMEKIILCSQSNQEGFCQYAIPDVKRPVKIELGSNSAINTTVIYNNISEFIPQPSPQIAVFDNNAKTAQTDFCTKAIIEIDPLKQARITTQDCSKGTNIDTYFSDSIDVYSSLSPQKNFNLLSFMNSDDFNKVKSTASLNEITVPVRELRVCAKSKYDFINASGERQNYEYRVAFFTGSTVVPKPVENITVSSTLKSEKNITIAFNASKEENIKQYEIYYSDRQFTQSDMSSAKLLGVIPSNGASSYSSTFLVPENGVAYYFTVIAVDISNNKGTFDSTVQGQAVDDLKPGPVQKIEYSVVQGIATPMINVLITKPSSNEDGSQLTDLSSYAVYVQETTFSTCTLDDAATMLSSLQPKIIAADNSDSSLGVTKTQIELPSRQRNYCLLVIAQDSSPIAPRQSEYSDSSIVIVNA